MSRLQLGAHDVQVVAVGAGAAGTHGADGDAGAALATTVRTGSCSRKVHLHSAVKFFLIFGLRNRSCIEFTFF